MRKSVIILERLRNECKRIVSKGDWGGHVGLGLHMRIQNFVLFYTLEILNMYVIIYTRTLLASSNEFKKSDSAHLEKARASHKNQFESVAQPYRHSHCS